MDFNFFTFCSALILLLPAGLMLTAAGHQPLARLLLRTGMACFAAAIAFGAFGSAIVQGDPDMLLSRDATRSMFRIFDGAAFHHMMLGVFAAGVVAVTLRGQSAAAVGIVVAVLAGVLFPAAAKMVWYGPLRRAGLIDIGGATAVLALTGAIATTLLRLTAEPVQLPLRVLREVARGRPNSLSATADRTGTLETGSNRPIVGGIGGLMTIVGWCALLYTTGVMQSPATCSQGAMNALRAAATAGVVAVLIVRALKQRDGAARVLGAVTIGVAAITALAGRAPGAAAIMVGGVAGAIGPAVVLFTRRVIARGQTGDTAAALWLGSFAACLLPAPYARDPDAIGSQLLIQAAGFAMCSGAGICAGILLSPVVRLLNGRTGEPPQPTDAS